jgi:hypothetical protein
VDNSAVSNNLDRLTKERVAVLAPIEANATSNDTGGRLFVHARSDEIHQAP